MTGPGLSAGEGGVVKNTLKGFENMLTQALIWAEPEMISVRKNEGNLSHSP